MAHAAVSWVKKVERGQEIAIFRERKLRIFDRGDILVLQILILPLNSPNGGFLSPNFVFIKENFRTRRIFSGRLKLGGGFSLPGHDTAARA